MNEEKKGKKEGKEGRKDGRKNAFKNEQGNQWDVTDTSRTPEKIKKFLKVDD